MITTVILVTGFGPFDNISTNPTEELVGYLERSHEDVESTVLPVAYDKARDRIIKRLEKNDIHSVISFGLNPFIGHFNIEEIAVNIRASEVPDVDGVSGGDQPVRKGGPLALRSRLPTVDIQRKLRDSKIPARRSFSAGVYICNEVFYTLLDELGSEKMAGFIHIPQSTGNISENPRLYRSPHMSMDMIRAGADIIMDSIR